jgi:arabinofuranan 3-O-arabinosyltransferase
MTAPNARSLLTGTEPGRQPPRRLGIFAAWRLEAYGYTLAALYAVFLFFLYRFGAWLLDRTGMPVYHNFTFLWVAGWLALHGKAGSIYDPAAFLSAQDALVGAGRSFLSVWPYPPTYFLIMAPLAMLPYVASFLTWELVTLLGYISVVWLIVRRRPAIALALASPFTVWNIQVGQSGFLTTLLLGAALLLLESRPVLAGILIGCLSYKPQWGILIPVALVAARQWRAFASAAIATALLAGASIAAFGTGPWEGFPRELFAQSGVNLSVDPGILNLRYDPSRQWQYHQTVFGLVRVLHGGAAAAWLVQGVTTLGSAVIVWLVWRSPVRYALKAAILSAAALVATPYAFGYDMAAIAIPVAFLATDQLKCGLLKGEQTLLLATFGCSLLCNWEPVPLQPVVVIALLCLILRRARGGGEQSAVFA